MLHWTVLTRLWIRIPTTNIVCAPFDQPQLPVLNFTTLTLQNIRCLIRYLFLHAACAKVAHYSGVGGYIEKILRGIEEMDVLADDGGSNALYHALLCHVDTLGI